MGGAVSALTGSRPAQPQSTTQATAVPAPRTNYNAKLSAMEQGLSSSPRRNNTRKNNSFARNMEEGRAPHYGYPMSGTTTPQNPSGFSGGRRKRMKRSKKSRSKKSRSRKN